jgi:hypothetical protein
MTGFRFGRTGSITFLHLFVAVFFVSASDRSDLFLSQNWTIHPAQSFEEVNGGFQSRASGVALWGGQSAGTEMSVRADIQLLSSARAHWTGVVLNALDDSHYYVLRFNGTGDVQILKKSGEKRTLLESGVIKAFSADQSYELEFISSAPGRFSAAVRNPETGELLWSKSNCLDASASFSGTQCGLYSGSKSISVYSGFSCDGFSRSENSVRVVPPPKVKRDVPGTAGSTVAPRPEVDAESLSTYDPFSDEANPDAEEFKDPSVQYRPKTWWHWFNGMVSRDGIRRDLESMAEMGIGGAEIFHLGERYEHLHGTVRFNSPEWYDTWRFVLETARPLGLEMGIHNCDGWSQSGGPWVTPESSMKQLVWTLTDAEGGGEQQSIALPRPKAVLDYYEDVAVVAWPNHRPASLAMEEHLQRVEFFPSSGFENDWQHLVDGNSATSVELPLGSATRPSGCLFCFSEPFRASGLVVLPGFGIAGKLELSVSADGVAFSPVAAFDAEPSARRTSFPEAEGRFWKLQAVSACPVQPANTYPFSRIHLEFQEVELLQAGEASRVMPEVDDIKRKAGLIGGFFSTSKPFDMDADRPARFALQPDEVLRLRLDADGRVQWTVPPGRWTIMRAGMTTTGKTVEPATEEGTGLEVDKFNVDHVLMHLNAYAKKMIETAGELAGNTFKVIETDSWESGILNWTQGWEQLFEQSNGYDLLTYLPVFANQTLGSVETTERFLFDLRRTYAEAFAYNYYDVIRQFCNQHGMQYEAQAHATYQFINDVMLNYRHVDIPMTEGPFRGTEILRGQEYLLKRGSIEAASAAHLFGKKKVSREAYTCIEGNWSHTPFSYKRATDAAFITGVNQLVFHTFAHQVDETCPGWQMDPWGTALNRKLTWWPLSRSWFDYLARCQYLLQQGRFDADLLVFYGDDAPGVFDYEVYFKEGLLFRWNKSRFDVIDGDSLRNFLHTENGLLTTSKGKGSYRLLVVQPGRRLTFETLKTLRRLAEQGASVLYPDSCFNFHNPSLRDCDDRAYQALVNELFGTNDGKKHISRIGKGAVYTGFSEEEVSASLGMSPAFSFDVVSGAGDVNWLRRVFRDRDKIWYFLSNHDRYESTVIEATFAAEGLPEIWDPETGEIRNVRPIRQTGGLTTLRLQLGPSDSFFVMFDRHKASPPLYETRRRVEEQPLDSPFNVRFDPKWGGPEEIVFKELVSWPEHPNQGVKHYSGIAEYEKVFILPETWVAVDRAVAVEFDNVKDVAEVYINGKLAGSLWKPPYRVDLTGFVQAGENTLQVKVANTWVNRCLYDATLPEDERLTWANSMQMHFPDENAKDQRFKWDRGPLPSGIIGGVKLISERVQREM